jgi:hypothetical protein
MVIQAVEIKLIEKNGKNCEEDSWFEHKWMESHTIFHSTGIETKEGKASGTAKIP